MMTRKQDRNGRCKMRIFEKYKSSFLTLPICCLLKYHLDFNVDNHVKRSHSLLAWFLLDDVKKAVSNFNVNKRTKKGANMGNMKKFMVIHNNPGIDCNVIQANWRKLAKVESATWVRTYINEQLGIRYCVWLSHDEEELKKIFDEIDVSYESILPVEETVPDLWGETWQEHLEKEKTADTLGV